tara:strand:+ start:547 stop:738 length:192 start_codon:yes stop_codon:yes gene_type:complete
MINVKLKKDEVKLIDYALELAYACGDGSPVLKPCDYNHPDLEERLDKDWEVAEGILRKIREVA